MTNPKNDFVEVKIQKKFLWMVSCPEIFHKGSEISVEDDATRLYWAILSLSEYEQFKSNHGFSEEKCGPCYSLWKEKERIGTSHKNDK